MKAEKYIRAKITIPIYTDRSNLDGCIYPKYAVENAFNNAENIPLTIENRCVGVVNSIGFNREVNEDDQNEAVLWCTLMKSDFEYIINKQNNNIIQDFKIVSFSLG